MKILVYLNKIPYDIADGYNLRVYNLTKALSLNNDVSIIVKEKMNNDIDWIHNKMNKAELILKDSIKKYNNKDVKSTSYSVIDKRILRFCGYDYSFHKLLKEANRGLSFEVVMTFHIQLFPYLIDLGNVITVCDIIDDPLKLLKSGSSSIYELFNKVKGLIWIFGVYYKFLRKVNILLAVTEEDTKGIINYSRHKKVCTIPNGADSKYYFPQEEGEKPIIIFTGNMDYYPNVNDVKFFLKDIWPKVIKNIPDAEFWVVGRNPAPALLSLSNAYQRVQIIGYVDDIRDYMGKAWVAVAPMIDGTGIKNKILEAWSMAKPVVATRLAAQGLSARHGENIFISNKPSDICNMTCELIRNKNLRREIGKNARRHVIENYTWQAQADKLTMIFNENLINNFNLAPRKGRNLS